MHTNKNFQRATSLILKLFVKEQKHKQTNFGSQNRVIKALNLNLYYKSLHIECYYYF